MGVKIEDGLFLAWVNWRPEIQLRYTEVCQSQTELGWNLRAHLPIPTSNKFLNQGLSFLLQKVKISLFTWAVAEVHAQISPCVRTCLDECRQQADVG